MLHEVGFDCFRINLNTRFTYSEINCYCEIFALLWQKYLMKTTHWRKHFFWFTTLYFSLHECMATAMWAEHCYGGSMWEETALHSRQEAYTHTHTYARTHTHRYTDPHKKETQREAERQRGTEREKEHTQTWNNPKTTLYVIFPLHRHDLLKGPQFPILTPLVGEQVFKWDLTWL